MTISELLVLFLCCTVYGKSASDDTFCKTNDNEGLSCTTNGKPGFCFATKCTLAMQPTPQRVLIQIQYPLNNKYARNLQQRVRQKHSENDATKMYIRGSSFDLSWEKGRPMKYTAKDTWGFELAFAIPGLESPLDEKSSARLEFRVLLDDSKDMLGPNFVLLLPVSSNSKNLTKVPVFLNYPWFFNKEGSVEKKLIYSPQLKEERLVSMYLPPSFHENIYKPYETLIVNDGQRLNYMLHQLGILMVQRALIKEILVVGIHNAFQNRTRLLAVSNGTNIECVSGNLTNRCNNCLNCMSSTCPYAVLVNDYQRCYKWIRIPKVYGQLYLDFIQDTVIPVCKTSYRAMTGAEHYGIMGFSLGGLVSCHAVWTRPHIFGSAACMSPSLWWPFPENGTFPDDAGYEFTTSTLMKHRGSRPRQRIYIDVGGNEGALMVNPARNASEILAASPYFEMNKNLWFYVWKDEYHIFLDSVRRMWIPLIAFYGTDGSQTEIKQYVKMTSLRGAAEQNKHRLMTLIWAYLLGHAASHIF